jgi:hypothetical protein
VKEGLNAKPPLTYEEILKNVLKYHPESRFNKKHLSWYKNKLRAEQVLTFPEMVYNI